MGEDVESQEKQEKRGKKGRKRDDRGRVAAFIVYPDSAYPGWIERLKALHVRGFISPCHNRDVLADGSPKKPHWHVILYFDGKKSREQIDKIREEAIGPDFNEHLEEVVNASGYVRYLTHMDDPEKAQYSADDVVCLGGADYGLASALPGDDVVTLGQIAAFILSRDITNTLVLIEILRVEGRRDWLSYVSRHLQGMNGLCTQNVLRLRRIRGGEGLSGDFPFNFGDGAVAEKTNSDEV